MCVISKAHKSILTKHKKLNFLQKKNRTFAIPINMSNIFRRNELEQTNERTFKTVACSREHKFLPTCD